MINSKQYFLLIKTIAEGTFNVLHYYRFCFQFYDDNRQAAAAAATNPKYLKQRTPNGKNDVNNHGYSDI